MEEPIVNKTPERKKDSGRTPLQITEEINSKGTPERKQQTEKISMGKTNKMGNKKTPEKADGSKKTSPEVRKEPNRKTTPEKEETGTGTAFEKQKTNASKSKRTLKDSEEITESPLQKARSSGNKTSEKEIHEPAKTPVPDRSGIDKTPLSTASKTLNVFSSPEQSLVERPSVSRNLFGSSPSTSYKGSSYKSSNAITSPNRKKGVAKLLLYLVEKVKKLDEVEILLRRILAMLESKHKVKTPTKKGVLKMMPVKNLDELMEVEELLEEQENRAILVS